MKRLIIASACFATAVVGLGAVSAGAAEPNCVGKSVSANAQAMHPYGQFISSVAPRNVFGSIGDAVAAVRAGQVPDDVYVNFCH